MLIVFMLFGEMNCNAIFTQTCHISHWPITFFQLGRNSTTCEMAVCPACLSAESGEINCMHIISISAWVCGGDRVR